MHDFDWRISIAHISRDCDFSTSNGVDRVIMSLDGSGVHLGGPDGQVDHWSWTPDFILQRTKCVMLTSGQAQRLAATACGLCIRHATETTVTVKSDRSR